ncbi:MAG: hypothetical protein II777_06715 [Clostridia bacterium]|nr:hypothetical protein [Clostridia bacterium]
MRRKSTVNNFMPALCIAVLLLSFSLAAVSGVTYARYRTAKTSSIGYRSASSGVWMYAPGGFDEPSGWTSVSGGEYTLSFVIANEQAPHSPVAFDQHASIEVFMTAGSEFAENASVSLTVNGVTYEGTANETEPGSAVYRTYGEGKIYRFEKNGEAPDLFFEKDTETILPASITVGGTYEYPTAVTVLLSAKPD